MEQLLLEIQQTRAELESIKSQLIDNETARTFDDWIPRKKVMNFLNYEDTQMAALLKTGKLKVSQVGNRKFIKKTSLLELLEDNIIVQPK